MIKNESFVKNLLYEIENWLSMRNQEAELMGSFKESPNVNCKSGSFFYRDRWYYNSAKILDEALIEIDKS